MRRVFGREPAVIAAIVESVVLLATTFGLGLSAEQVGSINAGVAAVLAVYVAWGTRDRVSAALLQLTKALLVAIAAFGANLGPDRTAAVIGLVTVLLAAFTRTQVTAVVSREETDLAA